MRATSEGHAYVVQLLLSAGANIEAADNVILMIHNCMAVRLVLWSEIVIEPNRRNCTRILLIGNTLGTGEIVEFF